MGSLYDKVGKQLRNEVERMKDKVILTCSECLSLNYTTHKNKKTHTERIELRKYCRKCGRHTLHKETK